MSPTLDDVTTAFNHWRAHRRQRGKIPQNLIEQAVALVGKYSKVDIIRSLGINHGMLSQWLKRQPEHTDFIALPIASSPASGASNHTTDNGLNITVRLINGTEITLQGAPDQAALFIGTLQQRGHL